MQIVNIIRLYGIRFADKKREKKHYTKNTIYYRNNKSDLSVFSNPNATLFQTR